MPRFEVRTGAGGLGLVIDGGRRFLVPRDLARRLTEADGARCWQELLATVDGTEPARRRRRGIWLRVVLLPPAAVALLTRPLRTFASWPALLAIGLGGVLMVVRWWRPIEPLTSIQFLGGCGLILATALIHELGHAAALAREGWPPGAVGLGLLWVLPVCWCDVSAVGALPRPGRARVDVAGVCWQLGAAGPLAVIAWFGAAPWATLAVHSILAAVLWNCLPFARTDGHWLSCDLFGLTDLEATPPSWWGRGRRVLLLCWRLLIMAVLLALLVGLAWRLHAWLGRQGTAAGPGMLAVKVVLGGLLVFGAWRAAGRVRRLLGAICRDVRRRRPG